MKNEVEKLHEKLNIRIQKVGFECLICGRHWGINLKVGEKLEDIPVSRMTCDNCSRKMLEQKL